MPFSNNLIPFLIAWNLVTLSFMAIDKNQAVNKKWRISENTLFLSAFLLGGPGILLGMHLFHHKTKHWSFKILVPLGIALNLALFFYFKYFS